MGWKFYALFGLSCIGGILAIYAATRLDDRRRRNKERLWAGWVRCQGCKGLYPQTSSDEPGYCSKECKEIDVLEKLVKLR